MPGAERPDRYAVARAGPGDGPGLHRLNWRTFVREIPQHPDPGGGALVDRHADRSTFYVARRGGELVGMVAVNDEPPFSISGKLPAGFDLAAVAPHPLEVRLLAVEPAHRHSRVLGALSTAVLRHARAGGHSHLLISGIVGQQRMYVRMGFAPLGPAVRSGAVDFVPMVADVSRLPAHIERMAAHLARS